MKQMAKFAQAIVHGPELLILDEPTNGLDPAARRRMLELIREMKESHGMIVLLCSHLLGDVEEVCDEAVILNDGRVVHQADLEEERRANRRFVELEVTGDDRDLACALAPAGRRGHHRGARPLAHRAAGRAWKSTRSGPCWRRENLGVHKLTHRRDTLEEIFLKAVGHLQRTPGDEAARTGRR